MPQRAVLYLRLSQSDDASTSIARQEADLRLRADREGWDVCEVLIDDGFSGAYARANADRALAMLRDGTAEVLVVWKFDRWSRQGLGAVAALIEALDSNPRALFVADRDGLSSAQPTWRIIASVLAEVARMERENTAARVTSSVAALRRGGRFAGGMVPFGYAAAANPGGSGRVLVVDTAEASIVRSAASRVLAGETLYSVVCDLNDRSIPTRRRATWSIQALRQILTADPIVGRVIHRGEVLRGENGLPVQVWEPVLDMSLWHRLRALLGHGKAPGQHPPRRRRSRLLSGVATCALCGSPLYVKHNGAGHTAYACTQRSNGRPCRGVSVAADLLDEYVAAQFLDAVGDLDVFACREEVATSETDVAEVERAISETLAAMGKDDADIAGLAARLAVLKDRRADLRGRPAETKVSLVRTGLTYAETWSAAEQAERCDILSANIAVLAIAKGERGRRGLDASRVTLIAQPAHPAAHEVARPEDYRSGRLVA